MTDRDRDLERRAASGDLKAAARLFYAMKDQPVDRQDPPVESVHVPRIGLLEFKVTGENDIFVDGNRTSEAPFTLFGVSYWIQSAFYSRDPRFPELGWTAMDEGGYERYAEHGMEYVSEHFLGKRIYLRRTDRGEPSSAASARVRAILDKAVNDWAAGRQGSLDVGELRRIDDRLESIRGKVDEKQKELDALEREAAGLVVKKLRLEQQGPR